MIARRLVILGFVFLGAIRTDARAGDTRATSPPPPGPLLFAFNKHDLAGFSTFLRYARKQDPAHVFIVADGCLRISGTEFGGVTTDQAFANYHLIAEWRWGGPTSYPRRWRARNSGILIHCTGAEGDGLAAWMAGLEIQLIEGGSGDMILVPGKIEPPMRLEAKIRTGVDGQAYYDPVGTLATRAKGRVNWWGRDPDWRDVAWFRGPRDLERPVGEWNRIELVCNGDRVTCYLNGQVANSARVLGRSSGRVLLQSEGAEILFRTVEIHALAGAGG